MPNGSLLSRALPNDGVYKKEYTTNSGAFSIALVIPDDPHVELPSAYLIDMPTKLNGKLIPHISHEGYFCYVEKMEADWNPNDLKGLYQDIDCQIQLTLDKITHSLSNQAIGDLEFENEFVSYWSASSSLYLLGQENKKANFITVLASTKDDQKPNHSEFVTIDIKDKSRDEYLGSEELNRWLEQRKLFVNETRNRTMMTHYISVSPKKFTGVDWPPTCLRELLIWLEDVDLSARDRLAYSLTSSKEKKHVLLLYVKSQDPIALYVELNQQFYDFRRSTKNQKKKKKRTTTSFRDLMTVLRSAKFCAVFKRLSVVKADGATLQSRDKERVEVLSSKCIALIGCGTIGGYLAHLLIRNGAGSDRKSFHLFDNDELKPHNFSRHTLTSSSFGKNKAKELAHSLLQSIHTIKSVEAFDQSFLVNKASLAKYDIIIDATGRPPVSKRLSHVARQLPLTKRPALIHAFNDGNGRAAKVFVDNYSSCYGCMALDKSIHQDQGDLRFKKIVQDSERKVSCGNTYTIYDASVSHITAAIAQEAVLNTLGENNPWTYSEFILDERFRTGKRKILKKQEGCSICHEFSL